MSCCGKHLAKRQSGPADFPRGDEHYKAPTEPCVFCAEKHISLAHELATEFGYVPNNRQRIIGQLNAAEWHLYRNNSKLAEAVRDIRHAIQRRRESEVVWAGVLAEIDALATAEASKENGADQ